MAVTNVLQWIVMETGLLYHVTGSFSTYVNYQVIISSTTCMLITRWTHTHTHTHTYQYIYIYISQNVANVRCPLAYMTANEDRTL